VTPGQLYRDRQSGKVYLKLMKVKKGWAHLVNCDEYGDERRGWRRMKVESLERRFERVWVKG
jgi:hypothetical protein